MAATERIPVLVTAAQKALLTRKARNHVEPNPSIMSSGGCRAAERYVKTGTVVSVSTDALLEARYCRSSYMHCPRKPV